MEDPPSEPLWDIADIRRFTHLPITDHSDPKIHLTQFDHYQASEDQCIDHSLYQLITSIFGNDDTVFLIIVHQMMTWYLSFHSVNDCLLKNFCWRAAVWKNFSTSLSKFLLILWWSSLYVYVCYWTAQFDLKFLWICIIRNISLPKNSKVPENRQAWFQAYKMFVWASIPGSSA